MQDKKKYYYWLDWFRWLSAFIVVLDHTRCWVFQPYGNLAPDAQGLFAKIFYTCALMSHEAVMIFFILSGFLVGGKTIEALINRQPISVKQFFINRMTRIWLPLAFTLILAFLSNCIMGKPNDIVKLLGNFLCLNGTLGISSELAILWTMPYIVWFYMLLASLIMICAKDNGRTLICWGIVLLGISLAVITALSVKLFIVVILGILAYFLSKIKLPKIFLWSFVGFAFLLIVLTKFVRPSNVVDASWLYSNFNLDTLKLIEGVVFAVIISQVTDIIPNGRFVRIEQCARPFAKFSYSMYLTHLIVVNMLVWIGMPQYERFTFESLSVYVAVVLLCVAFGYISYLLVEKHTGKIKRLIIRD